VGPELGLNSYILKLFANQIKVKILEIDLNHFIDEERSKLLFLRQAIYTGLVKVQTV